MAIIRKASSSPKRISPKSEEKNSVRSVRQPSTIAEMGDTNFGTTSLSGIQDGFLLSYNSTTDKFDLISADDALTISAEDQDISDPFVTQLEKELNLGSITNVGDIDGGSF